MWIDVERIKTLSHNDRDIPLENKIIKLQEETGELAQAFLKYNGSRNVSKSASGSVLDATDVLEEVCDVINVAVDIANNLNVSETDKRRMFNSKLDKWEAKQKENRTIELSESDLRDIISLAMMHKSLHGQDYSIDEVINKFLNKEKS